ncbi:MAG: hypothetical protein JO345_32400 [Streptosporangiaceae bacterium]|nr:hypothetical protein [Streptosporangiaceae bacterium]
MKRTWAAAAASVLAVLAVSATATANAATTGSAAASRAPIRTYTQQGSISFTGYGAQRGSFTKETGSEQVVLSPRLALRSHVNIWISLPISTQKISVLFDVVGNRTYAKSGNGPWVKETLSKSGLAQLRQGLDLYAMLHELDTVPGVKWLSATHFSLTAPTSRLASFAQQEFGKSFKQLASAGFKTLTINLWTDRSGRPVKITLASKSSMEVCSMVETFGNFNKPLTITAP